jgi:hypothetical protein
MFVCPGAGKGGSVAVAMLRIRRQDAQPAAPYGRDVRFEVIADQIIHKILKVLRL